MMPQQLDFLLEAEKCEYDREIEIVKKHLKKDLFENKVKYNCNKNNLKKWFLNCFSFREDLENIDNEDLYYIAEELCNMKIN